MVVCVSDLQERLSYAVHIAHYLFFGGEALNHGAELDNLVAVRARHDNVHVPFNPG